MQHHSISYKIENILIHLFSKTYILYINAIIILYKFLRLNIVIPICREYKNLLANLGDNVHEMHRHEFIHWFRENAR